MQSNFRFEKWTLFTIIGIAFGGALSLHSVLWIFQKPEDSPYISSIPEFWPCLICFWFQCVLWCSECEASPGYDTTGIQPVVKNSQIFELTYGFQYKIYDYVYRCLQDVLSVRLLQGTVWFSIKLEVLSVRFGDVLSVRIAPGINLVFLPKLCSKCMSVTIYIYKLNIYIYI